MITFLTYLRCKEKDMLKNYFTRLIDIVFRVFANCPGDMDSFPGCVIPKALKMVFDTSLLSTQQYKVLIKV